MALRMVSELNVRRVGYPNHLQCQSNVESIISNKRASKCSMIENMLPKGGSFSDFMCTFAMSVKKVLIFCNTKLSEFSGMTKSRVVVCSSGTYKNYILRCCRIKDLYHYYEKNVSFSVALGLLSDCFCTSKDE